MATMLLDKKARVRDAGQMYESAKEDLMRELVFNAALQTKGERQKHHTLLIHPINTPYQHTLSTQATLSTHPISIHTLSVATLVTHPC